MSLYRISEKFHATVRFVQISDDEQREAHQSAFEARHVGHTKLLYEDRPVLRTYGAEGSMPFVAIPARADICYDCGEVQVLTPIHIDERVTFETAEIPEDERVLIPRQCARGGGPNRCPNPARRLRTVKVQNAGGRIWKMGLCLDHWREGMVSDTYEGGGFDRGS